MQREPTTGASQPVQPPESACKERDTRCAFCGGDATSEPPCPNSVDRYHWTAGEVLDAFDAHGHERLRLTETENYANEGWAWLAVALRAGGWSNVFEIPNWNSHLHQLDDDPEVSSEAIAGLVSRPLDPCCPTCLEPLIQPTAPDTVHCPGCDVTFRLVKEGDPSA